MSGTGFDPRYPAEFQRGGDSLPRVVHTPREEPRADVPRPAPDATDVVVQVMDTEEEQDFGDVIQDVIPTGANVMVSGPWTARTWVLGLGAGMVTILLGVLCLLPKVTSEAVPGGMNYLILGLLFPLTDKLLALAPFIIIAGLAMLLAMFLGGAPRHPRAFPWLRSAAALIAVAALVAAGLSLFAVSVHPGILLFMFKPPGDASYTYPWFQLTTLATMPLALFGLCAAAAVAIVRPNGVGRNTLSTGRAAATGVVFLVGAAVTFYAPQIFTQSMFAGTYRQGDASMQLTPWPVTLVQVGPYVLLAGLAALLLAVFLRLTTVRPETGGDQADAAEAMD